MNDDKCISDATLAKMKDLATQLKKIVADCCPKTLAEEPSFQKRFLENARNAGLKIVDEVGTPVLRNLNTTCISPLPEERWGVDFIIRFDNAYVPVELKLRHKQQNIGNYPQDFIDDIDEIRRLVNAYDDMPEGLALCLTNLDEMEIKCNEKAQEYTKKNNLKGLQKVSITWFPITNTKYKIGISDRVQKESRTPTRENFVFLNEEKKKEIDAIEQKNKKRTAK